MVVIHAILGEKPEFGCGTARNLAQLVHKLFAHRRSAQHSLTIVNQLRELLSSGNIHRIEDCVSLGLLSVIHACISCQKLEAPHFEDSLHEVHKSTTSHKNLADAMGLVTSIVVRALPRLPHHLLETGRRKFLALVLEGLILNKRGRILKVAFKQWHAARKHGVKLRTARKIGKNEQHFLCGSPDSVCFSADLPLTPSLFGNLQMPKLKRLQSHDWPLNPMARPGESKPVVTDTLATRRLAAVPFLMSFSDCSHLLTRRTDWSGGTQAEFPAIPRLPSGSPLPCLFLLPPANPQQPAQKSEVDEEEDLEVEEEHEEDEAKTFEGGVHAGSRVRNTSAKTSLKLGKNQILVRSLSSRIVSFRTTSPHGDAGDVLGATEAVSQSSKILPIAGNRLFAEEAHTSTVSTAVVSRTGGCSCKRSQCRKKYCLCFSSGLACSVDCRCQNCGNTQADGLFNGQYSRRGCRCDSSLCKKKYCICFQAGNKCSPFCKCRNCHNGNSLPQAKAKRGMKTENGQSKMARRRAGSKSFRVSLPKRVRVI